MNLCQEWFSAKKAETDAINRRREIEDMMLAGMGENTTAESGGYKIRVSKRVNRVVDSDKLIAIGKEHNLEKELAELFRWKPEIDAKAWDHASDDIKAVLNAAITTKLGRPAFKLEKVNG